jgi:hypothetical protein
MTRALAHTAACFSFALRNSRRITALEFHPTRDTLLVSGTPHTHTAAAPLLLFALPFSVAHHPTNSCSDRKHRAGDKGGQVAFWDYVDVFQKAVLDTNAVHMWLVSALKFLPNDADYVYTTSVDGTVQKARV